ncbi:hypothetical protein D3C81_2273330 [compost metagenome]
MGSAVQGDSKGVVADYPYGGWRCRRGQGTVAGRGQQQVAVDLIIAFEHCFLSRAR